MTNARGDAIDERRALEELAAELDRVLPPVRRIETRHDGRCISALRWGASDGDLVFFHGGGQNAHTWDATILELQVPALAVDLPGHGHSDWRDDGDYRPAVMADAVAPVLSKFGTNGRVLVGMSAGGLTAIHVAEQLTTVRGVVLVDITPGATDSQDIAAFLDGPDSYPTLDDMVERAATMLGRPRTHRLGRSVALNARQRPDGRFVWRNAPRLVERHDTDNNATWAALAALTVPVLLIRGELSTTIRSADVDRFNALDGDITTEVVAGAGHAVQTQRHEELARCLRRFAARVLDDSSWSPLP